MFTYSSYHFTFGENRKCRKIYYAIEELAETIDYFKDVKNQFDNADFENQDNMRKQMLSMFNDWEKDGADNTISLRDYVYMCALA